MSGRVNVFNRIVQTISVQIKAVDSFGVGVLYGVTVEETADFGVVVAGLQGVKACFGVVVVAAVTERVEVADIVLVCNFIAICVNNLVVAPCIVVIFYHSIAVIVNKAQKTPRSAPAPRGETDINKQIDYEIFKPNKELLIEISCFKMVAIILQ